MLAYFKVGRYLGRLAAIVRHCRLKWAFRRLHSFTYLSAIHYRSSWWPRLKDSQCTQRRDLAYIVKAQSAFLLTTTCSKLDMQEPRSISLAAAWLVLSSLWPRCQFLLAECSLTQSTSLAYYSDRRCVSTPTISRPCASNICGRFLTQLSRTVNEQDFWPRLLIFKSSPRRPRYRWVKNAGCWWPSGPIDHTRPIGCNHQALQFP